MKRVIPIFLIMLLPLCIKAQVENPVTWTFTSKKINATAYELVMTASIEAGWHLFAQQPGEGPVPTKIKLVKNPLIVSVGKIKEVGKLQTAFDKSFNAELKYFEKQVSFVQTVTVKGKSAVKVTGSVEFMVGDDHQYLPPKSIGFSIQVGGK